MTVEALDLLRPLALAGLVLAALAYYLLIRRRRKDRIRSWEASRHESNRRALARLRHIQRRDKA